MVSNCLLLLHVIIIMIMITISGPFFMCQLMMCAVKMKNDDVHTCKFDMCGTKQKKMCEQSQYLREKREKPKKCVKYVFYVLF